MMAKLIWKLAKNDFKTKYAGSYLGIFWAFVQPVVTVLLYWFVFEKGLKAGGINAGAGVAAPFVLWLIAGLIPWFFFQDAVCGATNALLEYSYLVKKVVFQIRILPVIKIVSAMLVHLCFVGFALILYLLLGYGLSPAAVQTVYYSLCVFALALGIGYATCGMVLFFRDLSQIINILLQVGIWLTPIMWNFDAVGLSPALRLVFRLNPMFYVVDGYRQALVFGRWFWEKPLLTLYFWCVVLLCFWSGTFIFRKLKIHFADVL